MIISSFKVKMIRSFRYLLITIFIIDLRLGCSAPSEICCSDDNLPWSPSFHELMTPLNAPLYDDTKDHLDHNNLLNPILTPSFSPIQDHGFCGFDDSFNKSPSKDENEGQCHIPPEVLIDSYRCENEALIKNLQELCHEFGSLECQLSHSYSPLANDPCIHRPNEFIMGSIMPLFDRMNLLILERVNLQDQYHEICKELPPNTISIMENLDFQYQTQFSQFFTHFLSRIQDVLLPPSERIPTYAESCRRLQESLQKSILLTAALEKVRDLQNRNAELIFHSHGINTKEYMEQPNLMAPKKTIAGLLARKGGHEFHISILPIPWNSNQKMVIVNNNTDTAVLMSLDRLSILKRVLKEMLYATKVNDPVDIIRLDPLEGALIDPENGFLVTSSGVKSFDVKNMFILYNGNPNELFIEVEGIRYRIIFEHHEAAEKILHDKLKYSVFKLVLDKPCKLIENGHPIKFHIRRVSQSAPITFGGGDEIVVNGKKTNLLTNLVLDVPNRTLRANFLDDVRKNKVILLDDHMTALLDKLILQKLLPISSI